LFSQTTKHAFGLVVIFCQRLKLLFNFFNLCVNTFIERPVCVGGWRRFVNLFDLRN